ncbi:MAG: VanZ family protein [Verrucomicrobiota bacterium]
MPSALARKSPVLLKPRFWAGVWGVWFLILFTLSSMSHPGPVIDVDNIDKVEHALFFAFGGAALALSRILKDGAVGADGDGKARAGELQSAGRNLKWTALLVLVVGAAVGWFDEWHQSFTPGRSGLDIYDWLADITGSLLAVPLALVIRSLLSGVRS